MNTKTKESDFITLNNTVEEELRRMLVQKNNECNALRDHIKLLNRILRTNKI